MSQLIYSPFGALNELHRELNNMFDDRYSSSEQPGAYESGNWVPQVDIKEDNNGFTVIADLPGVDPREVEVTLDRNVLTIKGQRDTVSDSEQGGFKRRERISGTFIRQFTLPQTADSESIKAKAANGVLEITIPKTKKEQPVSISVET